VLTVTEAAKDIGVDPKTIRNHIHAGKLPAIRTGLSRKSWLRIRDEDWAEFKRTLTVTAPAA